MKTFIVMPVANEESTIEPLLCDIPRAELLKYLKQRAGLVIEHETGVFAFPHRSFQEYLAACYAANRLGYEALCKLVRDDVAWWRARITSCHHVLETGPTR